MRYVDLKNLEAIAAEIARAADDLPILPAVERVRDLACDLCELVDRVASDGVVVPSGHA